MGEDVGSYISSIDLWPDRGHLEGKIFTKGHDKGIEVDLRFLDLPTLHQPNSPNSRKLIGALTDVKNKKVFNFRSRGSSTRASTYGKKNSSFCLIYWTPRISKKFSI